MCVQLLHSTKRWSWISSGSAGSSQQLRHVQLCVHWRRCVWALLDCTACVCCVCGGMRVLIQHVPTACQGRLVPSMSGGRAPETLIGKCLSSSLSIVCLCRKWQHDKVETVGCGKREVTGFHWDPLTHETKQWGHVVFPTCQKDELWTLLGMF